MARTHKRKSLLDVTREALAGKRTEEAPLPPLPEPPPAPAAPADEAGQPPTPEAGPAWATSEELVELAAELDREAHERAAADQQLADEVVGLKLGQAELDKEVQVLTDSVGEDLEALYSAMAEIAEHLGLTSLAAYLRGEKEEEGEPEEEAAPPAVRPAEEVGQPPPVAPIPPATPARVLSLDDIPARRRQAPQKGTTDEEKQAAYETLKRTFNQRGQKLTSSEVSFEGSTRPPMSHLLAVVLDDNGFHSEKLGSAIDLAESEGWTLEMEPREVAYRDILLALQSRSLFCHKKQEGCEDVIGLAAQEVAAGTLTANEAVRLFVKKGWTSKFQPRRANNGSATVAERLGPPTASRTTTSSRRRIRERRSNL